MDLNENGDLNSGLVCQQRPFLLQLEVDNLDLETDLYILIHIVY